MATIRAKKAFNIMTEKMIKSEPIVMGKVFREAGYSENTSLKPSLVTNTKGWKEMLASVDNAPLLARLMELALCEDKRISHEACKTILLDLKGLGSEKTTKIVGLFEKISELQTDDKSDDITEEGKLLSTRGTTESSGVSE